MSSMAKSISSFVLDVSILKEAKSQEKTPNITPSAQLDPAQVPASDSKTVKEKDPAQQKVDALVASLIIRTPIPVTSQESSQSKINNLNDQKNKAPKDTPIDKNPSYFF
ncbi:hypothetical protein U1Q18_037752 [Sarracenia purpurea var. burkii]